MAVLDPKDHYAVLINTFEVEPEKADQLVELLQTATGDAHTGRRYLSQPPYYRQQKAGRELRGRKRGLVTWGIHSVTINDWAGLAQVAQFDPAYLQLPHPSAPPDRPLGG
jgi:hypothetical protein